MADGPNANDILAEAMRTLIEAGGARIHDGGIKVLNARTVELEPDSVATLRSCLTDDGLVQAHDPPAGVLGAFDAQFRRMCDRHRAVAAFVVVSPDGMNMRFGGHPGLVPHVFEAMQRAAEAKGNTPTDVVAPPDPSIPKLNGKRLWTPN